MTPADVSRALVEANQRICSLLEGAERQSDQLSQFVETGLGSSLGPAIGVIAKLLKDLKIGGRLVLYNLKKCLSSQSPGKTLTTP